MTDIKIARELLYRLEDVMKLGESLPLVAFPQLKQLTEKILSVSKDNDDAFLKGFGEDSAKFIEQNQIEYDDKNERGLSRAFIREKKNMADDPYERYKWFVGVYNLVKKDREENRKPS